MSSPVLQLLLSILTIDKNHNTPIYIQISQQIIQAVQRNSIPKGIRLPGSRSLSLALNLNRNTIIAAYEELELQGWVIVEPNKGVFVVTNISNVSLKTITKSINSNKFSESIGFTFHFSPLLISPYDSIQTQYYFNEGTNDLRIQPLKQLTSNYRNAINKKRVVEGQVFSQPYGKKTLNTNITNFINITRGLRLANNQLTYATSRETLLYIVAQLLIQPKDVVLVAQLGNFAANMIFQNTGATIIQIPVDESGIDVEFIKKHFIKGKIRCLYCTPRRHFPTTVSLHPARRLELIALAKEFEFAIIEDDFDYDLQWENSNVLPMAASDNQGTIIYIGTFASHLLSTFQKGIVAAPSEFIQAINHYLKMIEPQQDFVLEYALSYMIEEGEIHRFLKKSILIYKNRMNHFCNEIDRLLSDYVMFDKPSGGFAVYVVLKKEISLLQLQRQCFTLGLTLPTYILFQYKSHSGIRLGFAHMNEQEQTNALIILKNAIEISAKNNAQI